MTESSKQDHESYFTVLVRQMRETQKNYFRTRSYESLKQSKELESQVDSVLAGEPQQGKLFKEALNEKAIYITAHEGQIA